MTSERPDRVRVLGQAGTNSPVARGGLEKLSTRQRVHAGSILTTVFERGAVTRDELAEELPLSLSSIVKYVKLLKEMGFLEEAPRERNGVGRRTSEIRLDPRFGVNVVLFVELNMIHGALVSATGDIMFEIEMAVFFGIAHDVLMDKLFEVVQRLLGSALEKGRTVFGIGVAFGGYLDQTTGVSHDYRYSKDWRATSIKAEVEERFGIRCFVIRDTNALALGERYFGFARDTGSFLLVWVAGGVSLGIVLNGTLYFGNKGFLGEFGHIECIENGPLCYCGHRGCLETVTREDYVVERCAEGLRAGVNSEVRTLCSNDLRDIVIDHVKIAANNGDRLCRTIFEEVALRLGTEVAKVVNILNPELVVFRGTVIDGNEFLFENLKRIILNRSLRNISTSIRLVYAETDEHTALKGLGGWITMSYFSQERVAPKSPSTAPALGESK